LIDAAGTVADQTTPYLELVAGLMGVGDIERCTEKAISSCALAAASFIPVGKVGKAAKGAVEVAKTLRATNAARPIVREGGLVGWRVAPKGPKISYVYALEDQQGNFLKWGWTADRDPTGGHLGSCWKTAGESGLQWGRGGTSIIRAALTREHSWWARQVSNL
jgi:hypothetical protein